MLSEKQKDEMIENPTRQYEVYDGYRVNNRTWTSHEVICGNALYVGLQEGDTEFLKKLLNSIPSTKIMQYFNSTTFCKVFRSDTFIDNDDRYGENPECYSFNKSYSFVDEQRQQFYWEWQCFVDSKDKEKTREAQQYVLDFYQKVKAKLDESDNFNF